MTDCGERLEAHNVNHAATHTKGPHNVMKAAKRASAEHVATPNEW